jgi:adenylate cyclase
LPQIRFVPDDQTVEVGAGTTVLSAAIAAGLPHAHACGGRARCSTCRVLVLDGLGCCSPRNAREDAIVARLDFGPQIRLACQTTVTGDVTVRRLVLDRDDVELADVRTRPGSPRVGEEQHVAVMFVAIRRFTEFAETHLPYDVIHVLQRLFREWSRVVTDHGGTVTTFMGDGFMALFGIDDADRAAAQAVHAGLRILDVTDDARTWLEDLVGRTLVVNVGIHYGEAVVGTVHDSASVDVVTAIGDTVNVASRIEAANKAAGTCLLVSAATLERLDDHAVIGRQLSMPLPGKAGDHVLTEVVGWRGPAPPSGVRPPPRRDNRFRQTSGRSLIAVGGAATAIIATGVTLIFLLR